MNRFIANKNMYQRNELTAAFVVKKEFSDSGAEALAKLRFEAGDTIDSIKEMPSMKPHRMRVFGGQGEICSGNYIFGAVSNATTLGGILRYSSDDVSLSDDRHEVILVKKPENPAMLRRIFHALITKNYSADGIEMFHASQVRFESEDETAWTLDGERCEPTKTVEITNIPEAVEFIVPKRRDQ